jgi:glyoxylase-like metal-dependent hydrolase (beta-lactamase superfamily II)
MDDPLRLYLESLNKVESLDVDTVLTGHRRSPESFSGRIEELRRHHINRLKEIIGILGGATMTAYEVASRMSWDIRYERWDDFPTAQKWFATGEAIAHLQYLFTEGQLIKYKKDGIYQYSFAI